MCTKDKQLVLHQILQQMREMGDQDQRENGKSFRPSCDIANTTAEFFGLQS